MNERQTIVTGFVLTLKMKEIRNIDLIIILIIKVQYSIPSL